MRQCSKCQEFKPVFQFGKHKHGKDGLRSRCKDCNREEARSFYQRNPEPYKERAKVFRRDSAAGIKSWLHSVKAKYGCVCCSEKEVCVLDFHHVREHEKELAVTTAASKGVLAVERELSKCVVVCANCHRRIHAGVIQLPATCRTVREKYQRSAAARTSYKPVVVRRPPPQPRVL